MRKTADSSKWSERIIPLAGLACIWPYLFGPFAFHNNAVSWLLSESERGFVDSLVVLIAVVIVLAVARRHSKAFSQPFCIVLCGALGVAASVLLVARTEIAVQVAGTSLRMAYVVLSSILWGCYLAQKPSQDALVLVAASGAVSFAVQGILILGDGVLLVADIAAPLASMLLLRKTGALKRPGPPKKDTGPKSPLWGMAIGCAVFVWFEMAFSRVLFFQTNTQSDEVFNLTSILICAVCIGMTAFFATRKGTTPRQIVPVFSTLVIVYMAALLITILFPQGNAPIPARIMVASGSCFRVLLWMVLLQAACMKRLSPIAAFSVFDLVVLGFPINSTVAYLLESSTKAQLDGFFTQISVTNTAAAVALFVIACAAVALAMVGPRGEADRSASPDYNPCREVAESAGLSSREYDVMLLICRGYSAKRAANQLCLSESTINTHTDHIYKKLGVHSKQEMIELVEHEGRSSSFGR